jgi:hypothetical protein
LPAAVAGSGETSRRRRRKRRQLALLAVDNGADDQMHD